MIHSETISLFPATCRHELYTSAWPPIFILATAAASLRLAFRAEGLQSQQRAELNVYLNSTPVGRILVSAGEAPIQHATVLLPITALLPYTNALLLTWRADGWADANREPTLHIMRNSSIEFQGIQHFAEMPKLGVSPKRAIPSRATRTFRRRRSSWGATTLQERSARFSILRDSLALRLDIPLRASRSSPPRKWDLWPTKM